MFNAPTLSRKNLLHFVRGVLTIRRKYRNLLSPPMFDSPRAIRCVSNDLPRLLFTLPHAA